MSIDHPYGPQNRRPSLHTASKTWGTPSAQDAVVVSSLQTRKPDQRLVSLAPSREVLVVLSLGRAKKSGVHNASRGQS